MDELTNHLTLHDMIDDLAALRDRIAGVHWGNDVRDIAAAVATLAQHMHVMAQHLAADAESAVTPVVAEAKGDAAQLMTEVKAGLGSVL